MRKSTVITKTTAQTTEYPPVPAQSLRAYRMSITSRYNRKRTPTTVTTSCVVPIPSYAAKEISGRVSASKPAAHARPTPCASRHTSSGRKKPPIRSHLVDQSRYAIAKKSCTHASRRSSPYPPKRPPAPPRRRQDRPSRRALPAYGGQGARGRRRRQVPQARCSGSWTSTRRVD